MRRATLGVAVALAVTCTATEAHAESTAFFYGPELPPELLAVYERVVVEPSHGFDPRVDNRGTELVAYLSIGEVARASGEQPRLEPGAVIGENPAWGSLVADLSAPSFQRDLVERRFEGLWRQGYRSFFLDALDSYLLAVEGEPARAAQRAGLVQIVEALHARHPEARLLLNRGFEVLDQVAKHVTGVVAESLFLGWEPATRRYREVDPAARAWLTARLSEVQRAHQLPVFVIDYAPPGERAAARRAAQQIRAEGFEPWVTNASLTAVGLGDEEILPRRVLVLTHEKTPNGELPTGMRYLAPVLEQLGYVPDHHDLAGGLPRPIPGTLQGIVSWLSGDPLSDEYGAFLREQLALGVRVAMFGSSGLDPRGQHAAALGIELDPGAAEAQGGELTLALRDALSEFEAEPMPSALEVTPARAVGPEVREHLAFRTSTGNAVQAVASTAWGALASSHFMAPKGLHGEVAWVLDPYAFLTRALALPERPAPDVTTENGQRLALFVVRAGGLATRSRRVGRPSHGALLASLLARFPVPHTLDFASGPSPLPAREAQRWAARLGRVAQVQLESPASGRTKLTRELPFLTQVFPLSEPASAGAGPVPVPMAGDYHFIPEPIGEAYPYAACAETIARTDLPRRLLPVALDYHATSLGSEGGARAIVALYEQTLGAGAAPTRYADHRARVRAFQSQVITRDRDGSFRVRGGPALRTLRLSPALGTVDLARSEGVASLRTLAQGSYVTFVPEGVRRVALGQTAPELPHLTRVNGAVQSFSREPGEAGELSLRFELEAALALDFELRGLPAERLCRLSAGPRRWHKRSDPEGNVRFTLPELRRGRFTLRCEREGASP